MTRWAFFAMTVILPLGFFGFAGADAAGQPEGERASAVVQNAKNVALGKPYTVTSRWENPGSQKDERSYPDSKGELTDGRYGSTTFGHRSWTGFAQGFERYITVDLGSDHTLSKLTANFLQTVDAGIRLPRWVLFEASSDGIGWQRLGRVEYPVESASAGASTWRYELGDLRVAARYIRFTVPVAVWVFIDEVEAFGVEGIQSGAHVASGPPDAKRPPEGYMKAGTPQVGGAHHIILLPTSGRADPSATTWFKEDYLPYVAYLDTEGRPKDWMFDTFLLSPPRSASSGHVFQEAGDPWNAADMDDWLEFYEWIYRPGQQLDALDEAVAEAKRALGKPDYRAKVILTTVYPSPAQVSFGDVDGDGIAEGFARAKGREAVSDALKVEEWYLSLLLYKWKEKGYRNLELIGIYWIQEEVVFHASAFEEEVIQKTSELVHGAGYKFFWIPYLRAGLYYDWARLGFDGVMMQPNYMWSTFGKELLEQNAALTRAAGMGVEMEADAFKGPETDRKWIEYMNAAVEYGYMKETLLGYYQHFKDVATAARSEGRKRELYYDWLYQFLKGTYTIQKVE